MKTWKETSPLAKRIIIYLGILLLMVVSVAVWLHEPQQAVEQETAVVETQDLVPPRDVILYFALAQETLLYPEIRQIDGCDNDIACVEGLVGALAEGPEAVGGLVRVMPEGVRLNGVNIEDELVTLDFNARLVNGHPGGSMSELLTVYALVDSIAANFPHLRQLQLLFDGQPRDTLKGHIDVSQPVKADFSWTRNPEEAELEMPVKGGEDG
ncbi:MAG: hypothetical protein C0624_04540 [Desulfuromonas sp.]|nr:MAG: hypothetical protein C0624_04540 [Desulfuromonas sp.]